MRWVGLILLILVLIVAAPLVYLWLFPPFRLPDTGHLETTVTRDVDLRSGRATVGNRLGPVTAASEMDLAPWAPTVLVYEE